VNLSNSQNPTHHQNSTEPPSQVIASRTLTGQHANSSKNQITSSQQPLTSQPQVRSGKVPTKYEMRKEGFVGRDFGAEILARMKAREKADQEAAEKSLGVTGQR
jgi:hypothetical protein